MYSDHIILTISSYCWLICFTRQLSHSLSTGSYLVRIIEDLTMDVDSDDCELLEIIIHRFESSSIWDTLM